MNSVETVKECMMRRDIIGYYARSILWAAVAAASLSACSRQPSGPKVGIQVVAATYGQNCRAAGGNSTTFVAQACNGKTVCAYTVDVGKIGDPSPGCTKNFVAEWTCGDSRTVNRAEAAAHGGEAGFGSIVTLTCADH
jgi:hypothetical protein